MVSEKEMNIFIRRAVEGDKDALGTVLESVQDMVFNLSLRMMGMIEDAEDATQEIMIRVMTSLSSFKGESLFSILSRAWPSAARTPRPEWTPSFWPRS